MHQLIGKYVYFTHKEYNNVYFLTDNNLYYFQNYDVRYHYTGQIGVNSISIVHELHGDCSLMFNSTEVVNFYNYINFSDIFLYEASESLYNTFKALQLNDPKNVKEIVSYDLLNKFLDLSDKKTLKLLHKNGQNVGLSIGNLKCLDT